MSIKNIEDINNYTTTLKSLNGKYATLLWKTNNNNGLVNQAHSKI